MGLGSRGGCAVVDANKLSVPDRRGQYQSCLFLDFRQIDGVKGRRKVKKDGDTGGLRGYT